MEKKKKSVRLNVFPSVSGNKKVTNAKKLHQFTLEAALLILQYHLTYGKIHKFTAATQNEGGTKSILSRMFNNKLLFLVCAVKSFELSTSSVKENTQLSQHP